MARKPMRIVLAVLASCGILLAGSGRAPLESFQDRLNAYVKLRKAATEKVPPLKKNAAPAEIQESELALVAAIQKARSQARQGDILTPDLAPILNAILRGALSGSKGKDLQASIREGNPKHEKAPGEVEPPLRINAIYPKNAPLSTVPPSLLLQLPKLPTDVEYRFVGRTLVLRDRESNLIIDFLKDAVPAT